MQPAQTLLDEPVHIRVEGAEAGERVEVSAEMLDERRRRWRSAACYRAGDDGTVDPGRTPACRGSYRGVEPMGLLWSMRLAAERGDAAGLRPGRVSFAARRLDGREDPACAQIERHTAALGVQRRPVTVLDTTGELHVPAGPTAAAGVLVLGGLDGAQETATAGLLAARGCVALTLGYLDVGRPGAYERIPLEPLLAGVELLAAQPGVDARRLAVIGCSSGGDGALLCAAHSPRTLLTVACVPSGFVHQCLVPGLRHSAWTLGGRELPFARLPAGAAPCEVLYGAAEEWLAEARSAAPAYAIPVGAIQGPVLLVSAGADGLWRSDGLCARIASLLAERPGHASVRWLRCPGAGHHLAPPPHRPSTVRRFRDGAAQWDLGGSPRATAAARMRTWRTILELLEIDVDREDIPCSSSNTTRRSSAISAS